MAEKILVVDDEIRAAVAQPGIVARHFDEPHRVGQASPGMTPLPRMAFWKEALFSPLAETAVTTLRPWLPDSIADRVKF